MVQHVSDRVAVMYLGKVAELADVDDLYGHPRHPYSKALLSAVPVADPNTAAQRERVVLIGDVPSPINPPSGCHFHTRCPKAQELCVTADPPLETKFGDAPGHVAACHFPVADDEDLAQAQATIEQADAADAVAVESVLAGLAEAPGFTAPIAEEDAR